MNTQHLPTTQAQTISSPPPTHHPSHQHRIIFSKNALHPPRHRLSSSTHLRIRRPSKLLLRHQLSELHRRETSREFQYHGVTSPFLDKFRCHYANTRTPSGPAGSFSALWVSGDQWSCSDTCGPYIICGDANCSRRKATGIGGCISFNSGVWARNGCGQDMCGNA